MTSTHLSLFSEITGTKFSHQERGDERDKGGMNLSVTGIWLSGASLELFVKQPLGRFLFCFHSQAFFQSNSDLISPLCQLTKRKNLHLNKSFQNIYMYVCKRHQRRMKRIKQNV
jgi:hypothetical protein